MRFSLAQHPRRTGMICSLLVHLAIVLGFFYWHSAIVPSQGFGNDRSEGEVSISLTAPSPDRRAQLSSQASRTSNKTVLAQSPVIQPAQSRNDAKTGAATGAAAMGDADTIVDVSAAGDGAASEYREQLATYLERFRRYPRESRDAGHQGTVYLVFELERTGEVKGIWIARSSGYTDLDEAAVDTIRRAGRLPPVPSELSSPLMIPLPIVFSLAAEGVVRR